MGLGGSATLLPRLFSLLLAELYSKCTRHLKKRIPKWLLPTLLSVTACRFRLAVPSLLYSSCNCKVLLYVLFLFSFNAYSFEFALAYAFVRACACNFFPFITCSQSSLLLSSLSNLSSFNRELELELELEGFIKSVKLNNKPDRLNEGA